MMISKKSTREAYVWIWLPGETQPVVAGRLEADNGYLLFNYGKSYLERINDARAPAIAIYEPELPLKSGHLPPLTGLSMPGCIRDAAPDAWGRRVILNKLLGLKGVDTDPNILDELIYLLASGSDRIGALDFQESASDYVPRTSNLIEMDELIESIERVEKGIPLTAELDMALMHGSSIGGARPKALIEAENSKYVAKFSASTDLYSIVKAEYLAMRLAALCGLSVAPVKLIQAAKKDVLLIERFDRLKTDAGWTRKAMVSALTLFQLDEMMARYASYETFAEIIRHRFTAPKAMLKELFSRLVFNILCGNTDDHARNHAAFWDGQQLSLTPAYDICPQVRTGYEASQAMLISGNNNLSQIKTCLNAAHHFLLSVEEARDICEQQVAIIKEHWQSICEEAELNPTDQQILRTKQFLNPYAIEGME